MKKVQEFFYNHTKIILFFISMILLSSTIWWYKIPWGGDSTFTIASGMYVAGYDWSSFVSYFSYYGFGYSVLLSPLMKLIHNPFILYKLMLVCNCILYSLSILLIYKIMTDFLHLNCKNAFVFSISCIIWFPSFAQKDFVINEAPLLFWVVLNIYMTLKVSKLNGGKKRFFSGVLALLLAYGYILHSRSMIFMIAFLLTVVLYYIYEKKILVSLEVFIPLFALFVYIASSLSKSIQNTLWAASSSGQLANTMSTAVGKARFLSYFKDFEKIIEFIKIFLSNLLTYVYVTGGLFAFVLSGAFFAIYIVIRRRREHNDEDSCVFLISCMGLLSFMAMIFTISLSYVGILEEGMYSYKYLFYVRYGAPFGVLIWIVFFWYICSEYKNKKGFLATGIAILLTEYVWLNTFVSKRLNMLSYNFKKTMMFNIYKFASDWQNKEFLDTQTFMLVSKILLVLGMAFLILLVLKKYKTVCALFICISFGIYIYYNSLIAQSINAEYKTADSTIEYFKEQSDIDWSQYKIYFGGKGAFLTTVRYGLFDIDMEYKKNLEDIDLSNGICITNALELFDEHSNSYIIELDSQQYIVTDNENIYIDILNDYKENK